MMTTHQTQQRAVQNGKKAQRLAVLAFFLCASLSTHAQSNTVIGTAFGTNDISTAITISSMADGDGYLAIGHAGTTGVILSNNIRGTIGIENNFDNFTITATGGTITSSTNMLAPALSISGGTNLNIIGGNFWGNGGAGTVSIEGPAPPGGGSSSSTSYSTNATVGGAINGVQTLAISNSTFKGATYAPTLHEVYGTDGLNLNNIGTNTIDGTSTFVGGDGGNVGSDTTNTVTYGGYGLSVFNNSTLVISNGTFQGGGTGDASAESDFTSTSIAGSGLFAKDSTLHIVNGIFTGGNAGTATTNQAGAGVFAIDSDVTVEGGTFTGGEYGEYTFFGFRSQANIGKTNNIALNGGTFNLLGFAGEGIQYLTAGTNGLTVTKGVVQSGGTLIVTNLTDAPFQTNTVNEGTMRFVNDFELAGNGIFHLATHEGHMVFDSDLTVSPGAAIWFTPSTNGIGSITADRVYFETNSTLAIADTPLGLQAGTSITNSAINATTGIYVTSNLATTANFTNTVNISGVAEIRTGLSGILLDGSTSLSLRFTAKTLEEYWEATDQFALLANELDSMTNNGALLEKIDELDIAAGYNVSGPLAEQTYFTVRNTFQTVLHGMQAAVGPSVSRGAEYREQLKLKSSGSRRRRVFRPSGARGPQRSNDLRGWAKYYGQRYSHDADGLNPEYDTKLDGGVIGVDKSLGGLLVGISGGYGRYSTTTGIDGEEDITAYHGSLYGTLGIGKAYIDAGVAYGFNEVENQSSSPFVLNSEFDAQILSAFLGGGMDLVDSKEGMVFTPEASIQYSMYEQDAYSETSDTAIPRNIDAFDADSLRGSIGLNVSVQETMKMETFSLKYDIRAHWIREFNPDPGTVGFSLAGGSDPYELAVPMLDEDLYRIGVGCSFFNTKRNQPKNVMFRIDFDELFGDGFNSHNFSAKVVYAF